MVKMKNKYLLILISLLIVLTGCSKGKSDIPNEDKEVIENFLDSYFEQFNYTEEEWKDLINHIESKTLNEDPWLIQWRKTLTEKEIVRLISNRLLPNLYLREYPETEYIVEELIHKDKGLYSVNITFKNIGDEKKEETINISINLTDTEEGRRIDYIDLEEFNLLFNKK